MLDVRLNIVAIHCKPLAGLHPFGWQKIHLTNYTKLKGGLAICLSTLSPSGDLLAFGTHNPFQKCKDFFSTEIAEDIVPRPVAFYVNPEHIAFGGTATTRLRSEEVMAILALVPASSPFKTFDVSQCRVTPSSSRWLNR